MRECEMEKMLSGYGLMTAQIFYRMPDYENLLQTYAWQAYDLAPDFPELCKFLDFWDRKLDAAIQSVQYTHRQLIHPGEWRNAEGEFVLN